MRTARVGSLSRQNLTSSDTFVDFVDDSLQTTFLSDPSTLRYDDNLGIDDAEEIQQYVEEVSERSKKRRRIETSLVDEDTSCITDFKLHSTGPSLWRVRCQVSVHLLLRKPVGS